MRLLILLIMLMLCVSALFIGCNQRMEQPIREIVKPSENSLEKAKAAMERVNEKRTEAHQKAKKNR